MRNSNSKSENIILFIHIQKRVKFSKHYNKALQQSILFIFKNITFYLFAKYYSYNLTLRVKIITFSKYSMESKRLRQAKHLKGVGVHTARNLRGVLIIPNTFGGFWLTHFTSRVSSNLPLKLNSIVCGYICIRDS